MNSQETYMKELLKKKQDQLLTEINDNIIRKKILFMIHTDNELLK